MVSIEDLYTYAVIVHWSVKYFPSSLIHKTLSRREKRPSTPKYEDLKERKEWAYFVHPQLLYHPVVVLVVGISIH